MPEPEGDVLLYNVEDVCRMLGGISKPMVYRWVEQGELHPIKLGRRSMFTLDEIQRFVKEKRNE
jgi:excisionase family DNA binding protein